jgi:HSP20 family molecular chaperone IbpA
MQKTTLELMRSHVREIHQALTGKDLPEEPPSPEPEGAGPPSADGVMHLFAELEAAVRALPEVAERIPPFSFAPPVDLLEDAHELIVEAAIPGIGRDDLLVEVRGDVLSITGALERGHDSNGHRVRHAEIARGPFRRELRLPHPVSGDPRVEVRGGLVRIQMTKVPAPMPH